METGEQLLILTEAGEGIGYGHYSRCSAIRSYFRENGKHIKMALFVKGADNYQYEDVLITDWTSSIENLPSDEFSHVLIDSYLAPISIFQWIKKRFKKVVAIDDYHRIDNGPDLIINPNVFGSKIRYKTKSVGGPAFIILRHAFRDENKKNPIRKEMERVLVTLGGSDFRALLPKLISIITQLPPKIRLTVVAGNDAYCDKLKEMYKDQPRTFFHGFVNETEMKNLMLACDLAISACGQTLHELAWLGVPSIGICIGDDQALNMREYISGSFLTNELYWDDPDLLKKVTGLIAEMDNEEVRKARSRAGVAIVDNKGLHNIYHAVFT